MLDGLRKKTEEIFFKSSFESKLDELTKSVSQEVAAVINPSLDFTRTNAGHNFNVFIEQFSTMLANGTRNAIRKSKSSNLKEELTYIFILAMTQLSQRLQDAQLMTPEQDYAVIRSCREIQQSFASRVLERKDI